MSAPHVVAHARFARKMGDGYHMGVTAENVSSQHGIGREQRDAAAVESHRHAHRAIVEGRFREQILPVAAKEGRGTRPRDTDEHVRADADAAAMAAALRPAFQRDGTVTAGNPSEINDGAGPVVLASAEAVAAKSLSSLGQIIGRGHAG